MDLQPLLHFPHAASPDFKPIENNPEKLIKALKSSQRYQTFQPDFEQES